MAIQPLNASNVASSVQQTKSTTRNTVDTKNPASGSVSGDDMVSLTSGITDTAGSNSSTPIVDENRVASIKAAIQSGNYQINSERTAGKMMRLDFNLPDTT